MKTDIICLMRLLAALLLVPTVTFGVNVEPLPQSEYADTEVSTNMPFTVSFDSMSRLEFALSLDASPTNCVEVSIGTDANEDGCLSLDETDYTVGYRCGVWFQRDAVADQEVEIVGGISPERSELRSRRYAGCGQRTERLFVLKKRKMSEAWNLLKVTRRGVAQIGEVALVEGKKPGKAVIVR